MQGTIKLAQIFTLKNEKDLVSAKSSCDEQTIIKEISEVLKELQAIQSRFNYETESEMIDSCIFQEQALLSRYSYLLSVAKKKGIRCNHSQNLILSH